MKLPMPNEPSLPLTANVLTFDQFWTWLQAHPNCILSAGTADAVIYDSEDFHWHFAAEGDDTLLVQVMRGKQLVGELVIAPRDIAYVQVERKSEEEEYSFECFTSTPDGTVAAYLFVLNHDFSSTEPAQKGRLVH